MSDPALNLPIKSSYDRSGSDQALAALRQLQAAQQVAQPSGGGGQSTAAAQAAAALQRLATETQRTAAASSQAAVAAQRLSTEEQRTAAAASNAATAQSRAEQAALRLAQAQDRVATSSRSANSGAAVLPRTIAGLSHEAATAATALLGIGSAMAAISKGVELAQIGAQAQQTGARFEQLAAQAHTTGDAMLSALQKASGGTISDTALKLDAMKASLLGVAQSAEQLGPLLAIARDRAQQMGISVEFAFDSLVTGLGRGSRLILDNLGIMVKEGEVNAAYAASVGKSVSALTDQEKKQALINAVLKQGNDTLATTGGAVEGIATDFQRMGAASENAKTAVGGLLAQLLKFPAQITTELLIKVTGGLQEIVDYQKNLDGVAAKTVEASRTFEEYASKQEFVNTELAKVNDHITDLSRAQFDYARSLIDSGASAGEALAKARQYGDVIDAVKQSSGDWMSTNEGLRDQLIGLASEGGGYADAVHNLSGAFLDGQITGETFTSAVAQLAAQHEVARQAAAEEARENRLLAGSHTEVTISALDSAAASLADTQAKELQTLQTQLLSEQAQIAANAFLAANPAINESGIRAMVTAGAISPLIGQLAILTLQIRAAKAELGGIAMGRPETGGDAIARSLGGAAASQRYLAEQGERAVAAQRAQTAAIGSQAQKTKILKEDYDQAVRSFGKGSAEAIEAQTKLLQAQKGTGGSGGGGGGAAARETAAEKTGDSLATIERTSGNKLAEIDRTTQEKLAAIDAKYAEQRIQAAQALADQIAEASAAVAFDQTLDNFDAFGKDMTEEQQTQFAAREAAEVHYNERVAAAQERARQEAQSGDAQLASDKLKARTDQAKKEQEIEERAAKANADTGNKQQAAVAATAAAASQAAADQASTEIAIAEAKAKERGGAEQAEKDAVLAAADEQKSKVIAAAEESATKVKAASADQKAAVIASLRAQADAAGEWASAIEAAAGRAQSAMGGVRGPSATGGEGGGGESPPPPTGGEGGGGEGIAGQGIGRGAGRGAGATGAGDALGALQQTVAFLTALLPQIRNHNELVKQLRTYEHTITDTVKVVGLVVELQRTLAQPLPPVPVAIWEQLAADITTMLMVLATQIDPNLAKYQRMFEHILGADKAAVAVFTEIVDLRSQLATPPPPLVLATVQALAAESMQIVQILQTQLIVANQKQEDILKRYAEMVSASVQIIKDAADLGKVLAEPQPAIPPGSIRKLAELAAQTLRVTQSLLLPLSEDQAAVLGRFAAAASAAVGMLKDVSDLGETLNTVQPPIPFGSIRRLADLAAQVVRVIAATLVPLTEEIAAGIERYLSTAGGAISLLKNAAELPKLLGEPRPAIPPGSIRKLADLAAQVLRIIESTMVPTSEATATAVQTYADSAGQAISLLKDVADLGKSVADMGPPVAAAQIVKLADEALLVARTVQARLLPLTEDGAATLTTYAEVAGHMIGIIKDMADLRKQAADMGPPLTVAQITQLADEAQRITRIVVGRMVPASEEQVAAAQRFADTEGAAVAALKSVLDLPAKLFADYQSPSNAQIDLVVADANRIIRRVDIAARAYSTDGLEAAKAFSEAVGGTFAAFKDGLIFFQALNSGDFRLDPKNLATFEVAMGQTIRTAGRLGTLAATIPSANVSALQNVTAALSASYDSMIKLGAVPFGNLGALAGQLGGGGGTIINVYVNNPPASLNVPGLIGQVKRGIASGLGAKRS